MKRYYQMEVAGSEADIDIYGDITSWPLEIGRAHV